MFKKFLLAAVFAMFFTSAQIVAAADPENTLYLDLKDGRVVIEMLPDKAPEHVKRIKELVKKGFYDGIVWHRVIDGFMAQTGDPTGTGAGGSGKKLKAEFNDVKHVRGTVSMARAGDPNSADSQWFICFEKAPHLDKQYTVWGKVVEGMEFVDKIKKGEAGSGKVTNPDKIVKLQVAADAKASAAAPAATEEKKPEEKPAAEAAPAAPATEEKSTAPAEKKEEKPADSSATEPAKTDAAPAADASKEKAPEAAH